MRLPYIGARAYTIGATDEENAIWMSSLVLPLVKIEPSRKFYSTWQLGGMMIHCKYLLDPIVLLPFPNTLGQML
jgi:hypothetical protein